MPTSLLKTTRFRIAFAIWWWSWAALHAISLNQAGFEWKVTIYDSAVSNLLLAGAALLVATSLHFYIPEKNKYGYLFSLCAVLSLLCLFLGRSVLMLISGSEEGYESFFSQTLFIRGAVNFLMISCISLIAVLWYTIQDQQEIEKRKTEAERLSKDAELNSLRQQLQPHFLFNSLNSINALVGSQPQKARMMIQQLSDFLRGTLKKEQKEWVSLEEELQHLELYLDIEKVRFGHRLSTTITNEANNAKLPVMLLQPIVENAIKFGLYDTTDDITILVEAKKNDNNLLVQVTNPFDPQTSLPRSGTGFGLSSVQRRLYLLFARNDLLKTETKENLFITTIKIPQQ